MKILFAIWLPSANCLPSACQLESNLSHVIPGFLSRKQMAFAICICQLANCIKAKLHKGFEQLASWQVSLLLRSNADAAPAGRSGQLRVFQSPTKGQSA